MTGHAYPKHSDELRNAEFNRMLHTSRPEPNKIDEPRPLDAQTDAIVNFRRFKKALEIFALVDAIVVELDVGAAFRERDESFGCPPNNHLAVKA